MSDYPVRSPYPEAGYRVTVEVLDDPSDSSGKQIDSLGEFYVKEVAEKAAEKESMKLGLGFLVIVWTRDGRKRKPYRRGRVHNPRSLSAFTADEQAAAGIEQLPL